jgi:Domain of unknown function (DUF5658)
MWSRNTLTVVGSALMCVSLIGRPQLGGPATDEQRPPAAAAAAPSTAEAPSTAHRPSVLVPLYVSFATLQGLDIHSTLRAPEFGGREANPIVGGMLGSPAAFIAAKAGMTASIYFVSERLWKRNKTAAVLTMIALNSTYGAVVAHNYAVEARAARTAGR